MSGKAIHGNIAIPPQTIAMPTALTKPKRCGRRYTFSSCLRDGRDQCRSMSRTEMHLQMSSLRIIEVLHANFQFAKLLRHTHTAQPLVVALLLIISTAHAMPLSATL